MLPPLQPYADRHADPQGPGDSRPSALDIVQDEDLVGKLSNQVVLITGCTSGIGVETARALYATGARVWITARNMEKGKKVAKELSTREGSRVKVLEMKLDSFASIRSAAEFFLREESKLNVLINNAGIMATPHHITEDGFESQFATNHLGHHLLFRLLQPALLTAASPENPSRVVAVSSTGHRSCPDLALDDLDFHATKYAPMLAYARSKLANVYFANELHRRYASSHIHAFSLHPGSIYTPLRRHMEESEAYRVAVADEGYQRQCKSVEQGAATTVWAAVAKDLSGSGGIYVENCGVAGEATREGPGWRVGYGERAFDEVAEGELWRVSDALCGLDY